MDTSTDLLEKNDTTTHERTHQKTSYSLNKAESDKKSKITQGASCSDLAPERIAFASAKTMAEEMDARWWARKEERRYAL